MIDDIRSLSLSLSFWNALPSTHIHTHGCASSLSLFLYKLIALITFRINFSVAYRCKPPNTTQLFLILNIRQLYRNTRDKHSNVQLIRSVGRQIAEMGYTCVCVCVLSLIHIYFCLRVGILGALISAGTSKHSSCLC